MASQTSSFMVGSIEVTTTIATTTVSPPPSPPKTTTKSASSSSTPSPPKKKKSTKRILNPEPISIVPPTSPPSSPKASQSHSSPQSPPKSPKPAKARPSKKPKYPLQKDTSYPTIFCPGEVEKLRSKNFPEKVVPADIKIVPNNFRAIDSIPDDVEGYDHIFEYLWASPVKTAITISCSAHYHHLLQEFWWTAAYDASTKCIEGTVLRGHVVSFDVDSLRRGLRLDYLKKGEKYENPATSDEWKEMLLQCGYNYDIKDESKKEEIGTTPLKNHLPGVYHYLLTNIISCLGGNSGSFNQANKHNMEIMHALVKGRRVDFAAIIFADMVNKVQSKSRTTSVPFSRFFSVMISRQLGNSLYHQEGYASVKPSKMNTNVFKTKANAHVAPLSPHIRKFLCKNLPELYPTEDSLLVAQKNEDASVSSQTHSLSSPQRDASLIKPSARPTSPSPKRKRTRVKTHTSQPADVKKRQQESPKGSHSPSPTPRDDVGTQAIPPAVSKKTAGKTKGKQQAAPPKTSVGRGSEDEGLSRPSSVESKQEPQTSHSQTSESAPLMGSALSPADPEAAKSAPNESADKTQSADKGPLSPLTAANVTQVMECSSSDSPADGEEGSAESFDGLDFSIFLRGESKEERKTILAGLPSFETKKYVLRDEPTDEEEESVEEVFEAAKKIKRTPQQTSSFITNPFFSKTRGVHFAVTPPPSPPPAGISDLPDLDTTIPQTFPSHIPEISTIINTPSVSISTVPPSTTFQPSSAPLSEEAADIKPTIRPKWITLKDLVKKVDHLALAMETNCQSVVGLVDSQYQCHQEVLDSSTQTHSEYVQMVHGINNLIDMFKQAHALQQQVLSTLEEEVKPAQKLVSSRFDRMADRQAILSGQFSDLKDNIFSSINSLKEGLSMEKTTQTTADMLKVVTALEKSTTCLVARVDKHLHESDVLKEGLINQDQLIRDLISKNNEQISHLGKLTLAVNNLMEVVAEKQFEQADRQKLDKLSADVSSILTLLRNQQPAVETASSIAPASAVETAFRSAASKGEKSQLGAMPDPPFQSSETVIEEEPVDFPHQQVASPITKGEQTIAVENPPVNVIEDDDSPIATAEESLRRKGKMIDDSPAIDPIDPKSQKKLDDKLARNVMLFQRQKMAEATEKFVKLKKGEGSTTVGPEQVAAALSADLNVGPEQLAAALGADLSEIEAATKLAHEMESNQSVLAKESFEALMNADDEIREEARSKHLTAEQSQILLEQAAIKQRLLKSEIKKKDLENLRRKYYLLIEDRVSPKKISSVTVTASNQGKVLNAFIKRSGIAAIHTIADIQNNDLGVTEWVEMYMAIRDKTTTTYLKMIDRMSSYFDQIRDMETRLGITNSVLKIDLPSSKIIKPKVSRKRKTAEPDISTSQNLDAFLAGDGLINTNPPAGVTGNHGDVIKEPEHGMFFDTFHQGKRFFRTADVNLTTSETLIAMYNCCMDTSKDTLFASIINDELNKRKDDLAVKKFRYEN